MNLHVNQHSFPFGFFFVKDSICSIAVSQLKASNVFSLFLFILMSVGFSHTHTHSTNRQRLTDARCSKSIGWTREIFQNSKAKQYFFWRCALIAFHNAWTFARFHLCSVTSLSDWHSQLGRSLALRMFFNGFFNFLFRYLFSITATVNLISLSISPTAALAKFILRFVFSHLFHIFIKCRIEHKFSDLPDQFTMI